MPNSIFNSNTSTYAYTHYTFLMLLNLNCLHLKHIHFNNVMLDLVTNLNYQITSN